MDIFRGLRRLAGGADKARRRLHMSEWPDALYAVGDVHGCLSLLRSMENKIIEHATRRGAERVVIVTLGDLIDRGDDSAGVLDHLLDTPPKGVERILLAGNHEQLMLDFFEHPSPEHNWLRLGGFNTLRSYGMDASIISNSSLNHRQMAEVLQGLVPEEHLTALRAMPVCLTLPGVVLVHAGIFQGVPLEQQSDEELLWMRQVNAPEPPRDDRPLVVHGHTPSAEPYISHNRICIDTGAYSTGKLTGLFLKPGRPVGLLQVRETRSVSTQQGYGASSD